MAAETAEVSLDLLVDRFVSASQANDALNGLSSLLDWTKQQLKSGNVDNMMTLLNDEVLLEALLQVVSSAQYKELSLEDEGPTTVLKILETLLHAKSTKVCSQLLRQPQEGRWLTTILDVVTTSPNNESTLLHYSSYARVLGLQVLHKMGSLTPSLMQTQLLAVPHGLHRLGDLLKNDDGDVVVRNEALLLAQVVASWPSCAKVWVFDDMVDAVMGIVMTDGGGLNGNDPPLVLDGLMLVHTLLQHDPSLVDLVWQSPSVAPQLAQLLDLRQAKEFQDPSSMVQRKAAQGGSQKALSSSSDSSGDDLDAILAAGGGGSSSQQKETGASSSSQDRLLPRLTTTEENIINKVFDVLEVLMSSGVTLDSTSSKMEPLWLKQHGPLCSLIWELGLVGPPPPNQEPFCALPSNALQQRALEHVGTHLNYMSLMERHNGLDRCMYLVCTGGVDGQVGLSQAGLAVIRSTLSTDAANAMVMHAMAPSTTEDDPTAPKEPPVIAKLLNTVREQLQAPKISNLLALSGSLGALELFFLDATAREMMLKITSGLLEAMLEALEGEKGGTASVLKFLCAWSQECPAVAQALLGSTHSTVLAKLVSTSSANTAAVGGLACLLLGLGMENLETEQDAGGWTRVSILNLITSSIKGGMSGFLRQLESVKKDEGEDLLWRASPLENKTFLEWYSDQVLVVRRRIVQEMAGGADEDDETDEDGPSTDADSKSLRKLVAQQSKELEELRSQLSAAEASKSSMETQIATWKRRVEATPSQLDDMMSEMVDKNALLQDRMSTLEKDFASKSESFASELKAKEDAITKLNTEVELFNTEKAEMEQEKEALQGELEALSSAYAGLEQEYHSANQSSLAATESSANAEDPSASSNHLDALRTENEKLKTDARAADDWMRMAVQRMNDMGAQITSLQEIASRAEGMTSVGVNQDPELHRQLDEERQQRAAAEAHYQQERQHRESLLAQLETLRQSGEGQAVDAAALEQDLKEEQLKVQDLQEQLSNSNRDVRDAMDTLRESKSEKEELIRRLEDLQTDLTVAKAEVTSLNVEKRGLESQLDATGSTEAMGQEVVALREQVASLQASLSAAEASSVTNASLIQELQQKESQVRDLQNKLVAKELISANDVSSNRVKDDEIASLQKANADAQDWMTKAVAHNEMMSEQLNALQADKETLTKEIEELRSNASPSQSQEPPMDRLVELETDLVEAKAELEDSQEEVDELRKLLETRESELEIIRASGTSSEGTEQNVDELKLQLSQLQSDLELAREEVSKGRKDETTSNESNISDPNTTQLRQKAATASALEKLLEDQRERNTKLESEINTVQEENAIVVEEIKALRGEMTARDEELVAMANALDITKKETSDEIARLSKETSDYQSKHVELEKQAEEAERYRLESEYLQDELKAIQADYDLLKVELDSIKNESVSLGERSGAFEQLQTELQGLRGSQRALEESRGAYQKAIEKMKTELASSRSAQSVLEEEKMAKTVECTTISAKLSELQEWAAAAQQRITELEADHQSNEVISKLQAGMDRLKEERDMLRSGLNAKQEELDNVESDLKALQTESMETVGQWEERNEALEKTIAELEEALEAQQTEASEAIAMWSERCNESSERMTSLESEIVNMQDRLGISEGETTSLANEVADAQRVIDELKDELASMQSKQTTLEEEKRAKTEECVNVTSQLTALQDWASAAQLRIGELEVIEGPDGLVAQKAAEIKSLEEERNSLNEEIGELKQKLADLESAFESLQTESVATVQQWEERSEMLEKTISELEQALESQQTEASEAIGMWSERCSDSADRITQLESELVAVQDRVGVSQSETTTIASELADARKMVQDLREEVASLQAQNSSFKSKHIAKTEECNASASQLTELQTWADEAQRRIAELEAEQQLNEKLSHQTDEVTALEEKRDELSGQVLELQEKLDKAESNVESLEESNEILEAKVLKLEGKLKSAQSEASATIEMWTVRCNESTVRVERLESDLDSVREELAKAEKEMEMEVTRFQQLITEMEKSTADEKDDTIQNLRAQLADGKEALEAAEAHTVELEQQVESIASQSDEVIGQWQERVTELESALVQLEEQLDTQQSEADTAISAWEDNCNSLQEKLTELQQSLDDAEAELDDKKEVAKDLRKKNEEFEKMVEELEAAKLSELERLSVEAKKHSQSKEVISQLDGKLEETEKLLEQSKMKSNEFEKKLELTEKLKKEKDEKLFATESRIRALELSLEEASKEAEKVKVEDLMQERNAHANTKAVAEDLSKKLKEVETKLNETESRASRSEVEVEEVRQSIDKRVAEERSDHKKQRADLEAEVSRLHAWVTQLEEDLLAANDALQAQFTERVSEKATEMATKALQAELMEVRAQLEGDQEAANCERRAKRLAEEEVQRLKSEMATLLEINAETGVDERVKTMTMKASHKKQKKERMEMAELRGSLERALQDLQIASERERELSETVSMSRQQLSLAEQEVVTLKSEVLYLKETLEESRQTEASRTAAFEYRINSLEDDRESLQQARVDESETLRNEINQILMEKDRILQSLKESEKTNTALLYSTRKEQLREEQQGGDSELARLRISYNQLLATATEEGVRTERRIREAVAANSKSSETDLLVERELRVAAEAALENMKHQMEVYKENGPVSPTRKMAAEASAKLTSQLTRARAEARKLHEENASLRFELEQSLREKEAAVSDLEDKYKKAQAKAKRLERQGVEQANVSLEAARLHQLRSSPDGTALISTQEEKKESLTNAAEAFEYIHRQQEAIQEERAMYQDLLNEHDDLLALLAQHDLEKASLSAALVEAAGKEALDAALTDAAENAIRQFGKYARLSN